MRGKPRPEKQKAGGDQSVEAANSPLSIVMLVQRAVAKTVPWSRKGPCSSRSAPDEAAAPCRGTAARSEELHLATFVRLANSSGDPQPSELSWGPHVGRLGTQRGPPRSSLRRLRKGAVHGRDMDVFPRFRRCRITLPRADYACPMKRLEHTVHHTDRRSGRWLIFRFWKTLITNAQGSQCQRRYVFDSA